MIKEIYIKHNKELDNYNMKITYANRNIEELIVPNIEKNGIQFNQEINYKPIRVFHDSKYDLNENIYGIVFNIKLYATRDVNNVIYQEKYSEKYLEEEKQRQIQNKLDQMEKLKKEIEEIIKS